MPLPRAILILLAVLLSPLGAGAAPEPIWLAVGPPPLTEALQPLVEHRRAQGFEVVVSASPPPRAVTELPSAPAFLLLVGDSTPNRSREATWRLPTETGRLYRWRSVQEETYAADPLFSDLDADGIPDFPVGRIPARTPEQVAAVIAKILAFESRGLGPSDLGLPIWGGTPALGMLPDEAATTMLQTIIRKHAPRWSEPWMMFGNPRSSLSGDWAAQPSIFNERLGRSGFVTAMIGHGDVTSFLSQLGPDAEYGYDTAHTLGLMGDRPTPPHIILACDCGSFAGRRASLAEAMLFASGGPVAVVAATTESHPLTNYYSALATLAEMRSGHTTFGQLWHQAQVSAHHTEHPIAETLLKNAEGALEAEIDVPELRRDHLLMYALLGDPATRIPRIEKLQFATATDPANGSWSVKKPDGAKALHVQIRRPSKPPRIRPFGASPDEARRLLEQRNAAWAFETLAVLPSTARWAGGISDSGRYRWVAVLEDGLAVATFDSDEL